MKIPAKYFEQAAQDQSDKWERFSNFIQTDDSTQRNETPEQLFLYNEIARLRAAVLYLADKAGLNGAVPPTVEGDETEEV